MIDRRMTVGRYLVRPLEQLSRNNVSGAPGDYMPKFVDLIEESDHGFRQHVQRAKARAVSGIDMFLIK